MAVAGDTIYVGAGVYVDDVTPNNNGTSGSPITCIADTTGTLTGDGGTVDLHKKWNQGDKDYWTLSGIKISTDTGNVGIDVHNADGIVVQDCLITGRKDGILMDGEGTVTITRCTITSCNDNGINVNSGNAATVVNVSNCTIQSNGKCRDRVGKAAGTIKNCLLTGNSRRGFSSENDGNTLPTIWNCIMSDNTQAGLKVFGGTTVVKNSPP